MLLLLLMLLLAAAGGVGTAVRKLLCAALDAVFARWLVLLLPAVGEGVGTAVRKPLRAALDAAEAGQLPAAACAEDCGRARPLLWGWLTSCCGCVTVDGVTVPADQLFSWCPLSDHCCWGPLTPAAQQWQQQQKRGQQQQVMPDSQGGGHGRNIWVSSDSTSIAGRQGNSRQRTSYTGGLNPARMLELV